MTVLDAVRAWFAALALFVAILMLVMGPSQTKPDSWQRMATAVGAFVCCFVAATMLLRVIP